MEKRQFFNVKYVRTDGLTLKVEKLRFKNCYRQKYIIIHIFFIFIMAKTFCISEYLPNNSTILGIFVFVFNS